MICYKTSQGAWRIEKRLASGLLFKRVYFFSTKKFAIDQFNTELRILQQEAQDEEKNYQSFHL